MTEKQYGALVARMAPKSPMWRDCLNAFWIGGLICVVGQIFMNCYGAWGLEKQDAGTAASMTLVALSALLTGLSVYDDIAKHAGAGTLVPITGFANALEAAEKIPKKLYVYLDTRPRASSPAWRQRCSSSRGR